MQLRLVIEVYPECSDREDPTGLTEDGYVKLVEAINQTVGALVEIERIP